MKLFSSKKVATETPEPIVELEELSSPQAPEEWIEVEGYKGLNHDMTGYGGFKFEVGKKYQAVGEIQFCRNGFHFCRDFKDIENQRYSWIEHSRFFLVKALVKKDSYENYGKSIFLHGRFETQNKLVAKEITLVREMTIEEIFDKVKTPFTKMEFERYYASFIDPVDFTRHICIKELDGMYSEPFAFILMDKAIKECPTDLNGYHFDKNGKRWAKMDALKDMTLKAKALYLEGLSPDMRAYLLLR